jgi:hypothetical protein
VRDLGDGADAAADGSAVTWSGTGWTTVFAVRPLRSAVKLSASPLLKALPRVAGSWGQGRLFDSALVTVLVTDDGRVFAGAVAPSALYAAASK